MSPGVESLTGAAIRPLIPDLARLRIEVFRAFPYLYDGDPGYESDYLRGYAEAPGAVVVAARDGDQVIGAATGAPMAQQDAAWAAPFHERGFDTAKLFYCGESVLLAPWRGRGLGHAFFEHREAQARRLGMSHSCFCAVIRPEDHPLRPADYRPLDGFWRKRGYAPLEGVMATFRWKDLDQAEAGDKPLQFWMRAL